MRLTPTPHPPSRIPHTHKALHFWWYIVCVIVQVIFFGAMYSSMIGGQTIGIITGILLLVCGFWWMLVALKHPEMWGCISQSIQVWVFTIVVVIETVLSAMSCMQAFQVVGLHSSFFVPAICWIFDFFIMLPLCYFCVVSACTLGAPAQGGGAAV